MKLYKQIDIIARLIFMLLMAAFAAAVFFYDYNEKQKSKEVIEQIQNQDKELEKHVEETKELNKIIDSFLADNPPIKHI